MITNRNVCSKSERFSFYESVKMSLCSTSTHGSGVPDLTEASLPESLFYFFLFELEGCFKGLKHTKTTKPKTTGGLLDPRYPDWHAKNQQSILDLAVLMLHVPHKTSRPNLAKDSSTLIWDNFMSTWKLLVLPLPSFEFRVRVCHRCFLIHQVHGSPTLVLQRMVKFCNQLATVIPNAHVYYRRGLALKRIIPQCIARDFTYLLVINEDRQVPSILKGSRHLCPCTSDAVDLTKKRPLFFFFYPVLIQFDN